MIGAEGGAAPVKRRFGGEESIERMGRVFKYLLYLVALAALAFAIYAAFADLPAPERDILIDVADAPAG